MAEIVLELPELHSAQKEIVANAKRFNVLCCGRRFGKSVLGIDRIVEPVLYGYPAAYFTPTYKMAREIWRELLRLLAPIIASKSTQEKRIELTTGGILDLWSLDTPDVARGRKYARVVIDEAAMIPNLRDAWIQVLRPTLADYAGDAFFLSTPKGRNAFAELFLYGSDKSRTDWASWQMPTKANPFIELAEIESMRREMPERIFSQEVLAQIIDDNTGIFRRVRSVSTAQPQEKPIADHVYVAGVDWGKLNDFTVISILDATTNTQVYIERFNEIDYRFQIARLKAIYDLWKPTVIVAEQNSIGEVTIELLYAEDLPVTPFHTSNITKNRVIDALAVGMERGDILLLDDEDQIKELEAFEMTRLPSGVFRYAAPSGFHDDLVIALALAYSCLDQTRPAIMW